MKKTKLFGCLGAATFSALLVATSAFAWDFGSRRADLFHDRTELRHDWRELDHDRAELRDLYRHDAPASEIAHERAEIQNDWRELAGDRGEFWRDHRGWDRDDRYRYRRGWYDRYGRWHPYWPF